MSTYFGLRYCYTILEAKPGKDDVLIYVDMYGSTYSYEVVISKYNEIKSEPRESPYIIVTDNKTLESMHVNVTDVQKQETYDTGMSSNEFKFKYDMNKDIWVTIVSIPVNGLNFVITHQPWDAESVRNRVRVIGPWRVIKTT